MRFKIISIVLSASAFLIFSACSDFLKEEPLDQLPEDEAYDSPVNVYLNTVATLYNYVGGYEDSQGLMGTCRGIYDLNTLTTDEAMLPTRGGDWYDGGLWQGLFLHKWGVNNDVIEATWEYLYIDFVASLSPDSSGDRKKLLLGGVIYTFYLETQTREYSHQYVRDEILQYLEPKLTKEDRRYVLEFLRQLRQIASIGQKDNEDTWQENIWSKVKDVFE